MGALSSWMNTEGPEAESTPRIPPQSPQASASLTTWSFTPWWATYSQRNATWASLKGRGRTLKQVKAGIIDTGADLSHAFFKPALLQNPKELQNGWDDDGDGFTDDLHGFDFVDEDGVPFDAHGHGTHVAGLVGAHDPSGSLSALAENAQLIIARSIDAQGQRRSIYLARGIHYLLDRGARVINYSWGGQQYSGITRSLRSRQIPGRYGFCRCG